MAIKEIEGFPGYYASDNGNVFSIRMLTPYDNMNGYKKVRLVDKYGNRKADYVHRIVLNTFKGNIPKGKEGHHKDANPGNNKLNNLEIVTQMQNLEKRYLKYGPKGKKKKEDLPF